MAVFAQLVLAVQYMHERRMMHRDLKSPNVFMFSSGVVKLGDFGISKVLSSSVRCAETRVGTPYYMPPEICESSPYDFNADVWGLGVVFYEMLALEVPFSANNIAALALKICTADPKPLPALYGSETRAVVARMLIKRPEDRASICEIANMPHVCRCASSATVATSQFDVAQPALSQGADGRDCPTEDCNEALAEHCVYGSVGITPPPEARLHRICSAVDLAEAEHLLGESPVRRLSGNGPSPPIPWMDFSASASMSLAELEELLVADRRQPSKDSGGLAPAWSCYSPALPVRQMSGRVPTTCGSESRGDRRNRVPKTPVTCSKMLRNLERDFGLT